MDFNLVFCLSFFLGIACAGKHDIIYSKYSVHGVVLRDVEDQRHLHELESSLYLDSWQHGAPGLRDARVMVPKENSAAFLDALEEHGMTHYLLVNDVAKALEEFDEELSRYRSSKNGKLVPFEDYPRHDESLLHTSNTIVMDFNLVFCLSFFLGIACAGKHDIYSKYSVHGVVLRDVEDQRHLHELESSLSLDSWQHGAPGLRDARVMVPKENSAAFLDALEEHGMTHYLLVNDVAKALEEFDEELSRYRSSKNGKLVPFEDYPRHDEVNEYLESIAAQYPDLVTLVNVGQSYEGRDIKYLKISTTNFTDTSKPVYYMDSMIHAREWVTIPVTLYAIHRLVVDLVEEDRDLLDGTDWIILPVVNPDGYEYTHTDVRLWRRTRSPTLNVSETCVGVDANRNFDVDFNTIGVSPNSCSDIYPGLYAFSEPETQYIRDILFENLNRIQVYMNIHSHGNYVLFGFGNSSLPQNGVALHHVGAVMGAAMDAVKLPEANYYLVGNSAMVLYGTSGSAQDYAQHIGVPFSYTLELPGYGFDFRVPPQYINHINQETWRGLAATARLAKRYYDARE